MTARYIVLRGKFNNNLPGLAQSDYHDFDILKNTLSFAKYFELDYLFLCTEAKLKIFCAEVKIFNLSSEANLTTH